MPDALTLAIATAVAGKAAESMTEQARQAIAVIVGKVREKLRGRPDDVAVLDTAINGEPVRDESAEPLALILEREFEADPRFRDEIRALWLQAAPAATDDAVSNVFHGKADKVIQLRDVHGDLTIN